MTFKGSMVALVTPFTKSGEIDEKSLKELINWHIESNTDGIVLAGTTGEAPTLTDVEKLKIFELAAGLAKNKTKVIAGTGTYSTKHSRYLTKKAKEIGVDGCLVVVPYYNRPTVKGLIEHYREIAKENLPIILYHHPKRTGTKLSLETFLKLEQIDQIVAIKEASSDLEFAKKLIAQSHIPILSGDDPLTIEMMKNGAKGSISVVANVIPNQWKQINDLCLEGGYQKALSIYKDQEKLINSMFLETNPQCVKYALYKMNRCLSNLRLPLVEIEETNKSIIKNLISC